MDPELKHENVAAGLFGAFLGSLVGVACIVLFSMLGYVSALSGIVMAWCALKGYEKLAGSISKKGAAAAILLVLVMTWIANQLDISIQVAMQYDIPVWDVFLAVPALLRTGSVDGGLFWGSLALLYLFTLLGAFPVLRAGLSGSMTTRTQEEGFLAGGSAAQDAVFYPPVKNWVRPLRTGCYLAAFLDILLGIGFLIIGGLAQNTALMVGGGVVLYCGIFFWIFGLGRNQNNAVLLARVNGVVWRFHLASLNNLDRFTNSKISLTSIFWYKLKPEERQRAQEAALRAAAPSDTGAQQIIGAQILDSMSVAANYQLAALPLYGLAVEKENRWRWRVSYETENGKRRKITIYKIYPGFSPLQGQPVEEGPLPMQWTPCLAALGLGAAAYLISLLF